MIFVILFIGIKVGSYILTHKLSYKAGRRDMEIEMLKKRESRNQK